MKSRSIHLSLHIHKDPSAMAERAAHIFTAACEEAVEERGVFNAALSGGQTPAPLFHLLAKPDWSDRIPWDKVNIFWVDERCVGPEHPESNYGMARRELLSKIPATHYFRIRGDDDPVEEARRYEKLLRDEFRLAPHELPRFDFVLLGMGADGHTASLFPSSPLLDKKNRDSRARLVADVYVPELNADRLTLTLPVINQARCCLFLVTGADKHAALADVLNLLSEPTLPAQLVRPAGGDLVWIVDEAAASGK